MRQGVAERTSEFRGRVSVERDDGRGPVLVIRRGPASWAIVGITALLAVVLLMWSGVRYLANPNDADAGVGLLLFSLCPGLPVVLWAVNMWRRRTVLSSQGIEMRRLLLTERRPWPATSAGLTISLRSVPSKPMSKTITKHKRPLLPEPHFLLIVLHRKLKNIE